MEDLREVGQKAIESVNKLGASDAGDLVLGIGEIIEELRGKPDLYEDKLDHLEGLFREFVYGEGYELRNSRVSEEEDYDTEPIPLSGVYSTSSMPHMPWGAPPIKTPTEKAQANPKPGTKEHQDALDEEVDRIVWETMVRHPSAHVLKDVPKKKKKRWWNKKV